MIQGPGGLIRSGLCLGLMLVLSGCAGAAPAAPARGEDTPPRAAAGPPGRADAAGPVPVRLDRCPDPAPVPPAVGECLAMADELFAARSGSDAVMELELCLEAAGPTFPVLLTLGQFYLLAAQGQPGLVPAEGPAARTGEPARDRERWLARSATLLRQAGDLRPDDAVVDYLLAEVHRLRGDDEAAATAELKAMRECSYAESLRIVERYQRVRVWPAQPTTTLRPVYPEAARHRRLQSDVVLDLLIDPEGRVERIEVAEGPQIFRDAAVAAARGAGYQAARVGNYPVWSWLRLTVPFRLADAH